MIELNRAAREYVPMVKSGAPGGALPPCHTLCGSTLRGDAL